MPFAYSLHRILSELEKPPTNFGGDTFVMRKVRDEDLRALIEDWGRLDKIVRANAAYQHGGKAEVVR